MTEWVSITAAAERLTAAGDRVSRSTLSRYIAQHAEALSQRMAGRERLVQFDEVQRHRRENVNLGGGGAFEPSPRPVPATEARYTQADASARERIAKAGLSELELARQLRLTTTVTEVEQAALDAVTLMTTSLDQAVDVAAERAALKYGWDPKKARLAFKDFVQAGLAIFNSELMGAVDRMKVSMAEPQEEQS